MTLACLRRWKQLANSPTATNVVRNKHSAVLHGNEMLIFGGHDLRESTFLDDLMSYSTTNGTWSTKMTSGPAPSARRAHSAVIIEGHMIVFGGFCGVCLSDLYALDLKTYEWKQLATTGETPSPRGGHSAVVRGNEMIIYGGWDTNLTYHSDIWGLKCDFRTLEFTWARIPSRNRVPHGRVGHRAVVFENKMYVFGGFGGDSYWNDLNAFDFATCTWKTMRVARGSSPPPRTYHVMELAGSQLLVIGGSDHKGEMYDVWLLDIRRREWREIECTGNAVGRFAHTSVTDGRIVLVYGGIGKQSVVHNPVDTDPELFELVVEDWAADNSLAHTMRRYLVEHHSDLLPLPTRGLPTNVANALSSYVKEFKQKGEEAFTALIDNPTPTPQRYRRPDCLSPELATRGGDVPEVTGKRLVWDDDEPAPTWGMWAPDAAQRSQSGSSEGSTNSAQMGASSSSSASSSETPPSPFRSSPLSP